MREKLKDMVRCSLTAILALLLVLSAFSPEVLAEARTEYIESSENAIGLDDEDENPSSENQEDTDRNRKGELGLSLLVSREFSHPGGPTRQLNM